MTGPRWSWATAGLLALVGVLALVTRPTAPPVPPTSTLGDVAVQLTSFPAATTAAVAAWVGPVRVARLVAIGSQLVVPVVLVATGTGRRLVARLGGRRAAAWRGAAVVVVAVAVATMPLRVWIGWWHAGAFGFRTSSATRYAIELAGDVALEVVLTATAVALLVALLDRRPGDWPALATVGGTVLTALLAMAAPLVMTEALLRPVPLDDPTLDELVAPLVATSDVGAQAIEVGAASVRTTRANAYVTGIGPSRRVVLYDTLLDRPPDVVAAVVAHELAHAEHRDVPRGVAAAATGLLVVTVLGRRVHRELVRRDAVPPPALLGATVAAVALVVQVLGAPVVAWESRRVESAADARSLALTGDPAAMVALQRGFVIEDLADPDPPAWVRLLRSHPTPAERIERAVAFAQERGLDPVPQGPS